MTEHTARRHCSISLELASPSGARASCRFSSRGRDHGARSVGTTPCTCGERGGAAASRMRRRVIAGYAAASRASYGTLFTAPPHPDSATMSRRHGPLTACHRGAASATVATARWWLRAHASRRAVSPATNGSYVSAEAHRSRHSDCAAGACARTRVTGAHPAGAGRTRIVVRAERGHAAYIASLVTGVFHDLAVSIPRSPAGVARAIARRRTRPSGRARTQVRRAAERGAMRGGPRPAFARKHAGVDHAATRQLIPSCAAPTPGE